MQARASFKGHALQNEAAGFVAEYSVRKRLAKLGFHAPMADLSALKAEIFAIIDIELDKCQADDMRSKNGRK